MKKRVLCSNLPWCKLSVLLLGCLLLPALSDTALPLAQSLRFLLHWLPVLLLFCYLLIHKQPLLSHLMQYGIQLLPAVVLEWPMCGQKSLHRIQGSNPRIHPSEMPGLLKHCSVLVQHSWRKADCTPLTHGSHLVGYYLQFHGYKPPVAGERHLNATSKEAGALNRLYDHWACNTSWTNCPIPAIPKASCWWNGVTLVPSARRSLTASVIFHV